MNEQIQTIIDRARELIAAATQRPWRNGTGTSVVADVPVPEMSGSDELRFYGGHLVGESIVERNADAIVFAVNNIGTLCDALERSRFALEWWAADRAIDVEALREAWAVMDSMARAAGVVGAFLKQAAPLLRPDASGNVKAPNHVTATFTDGGQPYEFTIRREGGKTPAEIIGEITARAEGAEHARDIFLDALGRIGAMCMGVLGEEWEGAPHDEMVGGLIDRVEEAEAQAAVMRAALTDAEDTIRDQAARFGAGFPCSVIDACEAAIATDAGRALLDRLTAAETRVADMESVREEQAAKLRRHLDELRAAALHIEDLESKNARMEDAEAERDALRDRAGIAEGREACAKANAAEIAGRLDAQNAGLVQMARDRDLLRVKLDAAEAKAARLEARTARVCAGCVGTGIAKFGADEVVNCKACGGAGAVIVEGVAQRGVMIPDELPPVAPVQGEWKKRPAGTVPWSVHLKAFGTYRKILGNGQSAERIAERGGFSYREMQCLLAGHYSHECKVDHEPVRGWVEKLA